MMKVGFSRPTRLGSHGQDFERQVRRQLSRDLRQGLEKFQEAILQTPVYTGTTLINYIWSLGEKVDTVRKPVKDPELPGKTSEMELGSEPRRAAQTAVLEAEFRRVMMSLASNPFQSVYLVNNTPYFDLIEYGTYAQEGENSSRTPPGGMTRRGETSLQVSFEGVLQRVS